MALVVAVFVALFGLAAGASAGTTTATDSDAVRAKLAKRLKLSVAERSALDIESVKVSGEEGIGLLATVTFRGDIAQRLGRKHLKNGAVALILRPKGSPTASGGGLVSQGSPLSQRLLSATSSSVVGAIRDGRTLTFLISGPGFSNVGAVEVKAFASVPGRKGGPRKRSARAAAVSFDRFANAAPADGLLADTDPGPLNCDDLGRDRLRDALNGMLDGLVEEERRLERAIELNAKAIESNKKALVKHDQPEEVKEEIVERLLKYGERRAKLKAALDQVRKTKQAVLELLKALETTNASRCGASFDWDLFAANEVMGNGRFLSAGLGSAGALDAVKVVVPGRSITNSLCPTQLPNGAVSTTSVTDDTLTCTGGALPVDTQFSLNVRTEPFPSPGMGGQLFGRQNGTFKGPFAITGP